MTHAPSLVSKRRGDRVGAALTSLAGGALALQLLLIVGLLALLVWHGSAYFWQREVVELRLDDGTRLAGEIHAREPILDHAAGGRVTGEREKLKVGNQDLYGQSLRWIDLARVTERTIPRDLVMLERVEYGSFYGRLLRVRDGEHVLAASGESAWIKVKEVAPIVAGVRARIRAIEKGPQDALNKEMEQLRLAARRVELEAPAAEARARALAEIATRRQALDERWARLGSELKELRAQLAAKVVDAETIDGTPKTIALGEIVHALRPNELSILERCGLWIARVWEFITDDPRESNTEGGIFPQIFGTVLMVFLMTFVVTPLGVLAALYLREYARQGALVRLVRIAVNNLAGVPSIVFGVFGLGFFVYGVGGALDRMFFEEALPKATFGTGGILWAALTLALLTVPVVIVATEEGLASVPRITREGSLALGATKLETTWRVVLPAAAPGILTGVILAIARAAGEVAPLMIVGMVKSASLPVDSTFPFLHPELKFMHLGFHIYDAGFQSPNVEAAKPLVFATALLLVAIVTLMNLSAIWLRNHLRRRYATSAV